MRLVTISQIAAASLLCIFAHLGVKGAPANPIGRIYKQPDGSETPMLVLRGDQHYNWMSDKDGFTVVRDPQGWYTYAEKIQNGDIVSTGITVGAVNPRKMGLTPELIHDDSRRHKPNGLGWRTGRSVLEHRSLVSVPETALCSFSGSKSEPCRLKSLVVLVRFSDHQDRQLPSSQQVDVLFNNNGATENNTAPTGSISDVFSMNSYDTFVMESFVSEWIQLNRTEEQTVDGNLGLNELGTIASWNEALTKLNDFGAVHYPDFDVDNDDEIDCLVLLHSGVAAETGGVDCETGKDTKGRIWSHATSSSLYTSPEGIGVGRFYVASSVWDTCPPGGPDTKWDIARLGVIAHECAHFLGLPDLYDTTGGAGVGTFDLLGNMWGWYGNQWYPPLMGAWSRLKLGWAKAEHITESGDYSIGAACSSNKIFQIDHRMEKGEYFLIEYRYPCGFDVEMTDHSYDWTKDRTGAALWHIDESGLLDIDFTSEGIPGGGHSYSHYMVALVQGDGNFDLERGANKGDHYDLFLAGDYENVMEKSYKITNEGICKNNGETMSQPNTKSYGSGAEKETGIDLIFGVYDHELPLRVKLGPE